VKWPFLSLVAAALCLEIVGVAEGFSSSLGRPISGTYASIPTQFVAVTALAFPILPYLSIAMIAGALLFGVLGPTRPTPVDRVGNPTIDHRFSRSFREHLLLILAIVVAAVLVWIPRSLQSLPIGGDTLFYMSVVGTMAREGPLWAVIYTDKPFFYLAVYGLQQISGLSTADFFEVLPVIFGIATTASVWFFVDSFYKEAAGYAALLTATSTSLMRTSIDLYASFFATILLFLTLGIYLRYRGETQFRHRTLLQILFAMTLMSYWFVWGLLLVMLGLAEVMSKEPTRRLKALLVVSIPSIVVLGLFIGVSILRPPPLYWGLGSSFGLYLGKTVTPVGTITYTSATLDLSDLGLLQYNPIVPILAVVGLFFYRPRNFPGRTIYIWSFIMLAFSLISTTGLHAALLIPLPVLAGIGLRRMVETL
jgi:hypothetical protein